MLRLPHFALFSLSVAMFAALLALAATLSSPTASAGTNAVPPEAYERLAADGSVELILSVENSDILSRARDTLRERGRGAAADELERGLGMRLTEAADELPADVEAAERFDQVGSMVVTVHSTIALDMLGRLSGFVRIDLPQVMAPMLTQSLALIHQPEAAVEGHTGDGTAIAIIDTGIDYTRAAFGSCTAPGVPSGCRVVYADDFTFFDDGQPDAGTPKHGTNVAGIAAGVAPGADLISLDVFGGAAADDEDIIQAIEWVLDHAGEYNIKAVNLSLGTPNEYPTEDAPPFAGPCPTGLKSAFQALRAAGILPVVSAGNGGNDSEISYPGCIAEAYTVGATYDASGVNGAFSECSDDPTVVDTVACSSNSHGSMLDSLAPGARISAAGLNNWAGTSMAAPHVAAAAAVLAAIPGTSVEEIDSILREAGPAVFDPRNEVTKHRLDLAQAVTMATSVSIPMTGATTLDGDADGRIDRVRVTLAEDVNDDFSELEFSVEGYSVTGVTTGTVGDDVVLVDVAEGDEPDSAATPLVTLVSNESLGTEEALVGPVGGSVEAVDGAGPAIASAQTVAKRTVEIEFSEAVDGSTLAKDDIKLFIEGTRRAIAKLVQVDEDTWEILVRRAAKWTPGEDGTVKFKAANLVEDAGGNTNAQTASVTVTAGF